MVLWPRRSELCSADVLSGLRILLAYMLIERVAVSLAKGVVVGGQCRISRRLSRRYGHASSRRWLGPFLLAINWTAAFHECVDLLLAFCVLWKYLVDQRPKIIVNVGYILIARLVGVFIRRYEVLSINVLGFNQIIYARP
jgi:hypothetical protein